MINLKVYYYIIIFCFTLISDACEQTTSNNNKFINSNMKDSVHINNFSGKTGNPYYSHSDTNKLDISDQEWKRVLTSDVYAVSRKKDTELPFTGKYWDFDGKGTYYCAACGNVLFRSDAKFASSCGWPSFFEQINQKSIFFIKDNSNGMSRTEALCNRCGGHLGHLFDDGPLPTGKRFCMNSIVLDFEPDIEITKQANENNKDTIILGGGCFWCVEAVYENLVGVISVESGYAGGNLPNPSYEQVCTGKTNHAEVVQIAYEKANISLEEILKVFFIVHDPTSLNRQGDDIGNQYRSVIFYRNKEQKLTAENIINELNKSKVYTSPIVTKVEPFSSFYKAESYHQNYYNNNKTQPYCKMIVQPKLEKFEKVFKNRLKH
jgi:peptide methionine sulfoxide reductase msrA/msrB